MDYEWKISSRGDLKGKKINACTHTAFSWEGWGWGLKDCGQGVSNQTTLLEVYVILLEQHILKSIFLISIDFFYFV